MSCPVCKRGFKAGSGPMGVAQAYVEDMASEESSTCVHGVSVIVQGLRALRLVCEDCTALSGVSVLAGQRDSARAYADAVDALVDAIQGVGRWVDGVVSAGSLTKCAALNSKAQAYHTQAQAIAQRVPSEFQGLSLSEVQDRHTESKAALAEREETLRQWQNRLSGSVAAADRASRLCAGREGTVTEAQAKVNALREATKAGHDLRQRRERLSESLTSQHTRRQEAQAQLTPLTQALSSGDMEAAVTLGHSMHICEAWTKGCRRVAEVEAGREELTQREEGLRKLQAHLSKVWVSRVCTIL
ncbi:hypothetical protein KIPB_001592 [Kipferlia bialata]|uniref:Uncharacterized protein n=1 Tax=Kipferlia bialata TaxID=797122 RepID=A0A9K3CQT3_9EUKA|nr:hypothetical protein KIPB_001592 [Kipferlia bialata]|eukprot:g1592.t1